VMGMELSNLLLSYRPPISADLGGSSIYKNKKYFKEWKLYSMDSLALYSLKGVAKYDNTMWKAIYLKHEMPEREKYK